MNSVLVDMRRSVKRPSPWRYCFYDPESDEVLVVHEGWVPYERAKAQWVRVGCHSEASIIAQKRSIRLGGRPFDGYRGAYCDSRDRPRPRVMVLPWPFGMRRMGWRPFTVSEHAS